MRVNLWRKGIRVPIEVLKPTSEKAWLAMREKNLNSTEISTLFGCNPYVTTLELFHRFAGRFRIEQDNAYTAWGQRLQYSIARGAAKDNGWQIRAMREYIQDTDRRLGASFDYEIVSPFSALLEIKNVYGMMFREQWISEGGDIEAPPHIELQIQQQLMLSGRPKCVLAALVDGNKLELTTREPKESVWRAIQARAAQFWEQVDSNTPPPPNFPMDASFLCKLYSGTTEGKAIHMEDPELLALAEEYRAAGASESEAKERKEVAKAKILERIQDAEKVLGSAFTISAGFIASKVIESYERKGYRGFRVTWKKGA